MDNNIKKIRGEKGITQEKLSQLTGISRVHLTNIENGVALPSVSYALEISKRLGKSVEEVFPISSNEEVE
ncbi:MAG: helix-turn-helix transcriptional regulator [Aminipila sp.]